MNFFISYTSANADWARWIAYTLENAGYSVVLQDWDFVAGTNWIDQMHNAVCDSDRTIAVLSQDYLCASKFGTAEWQAVWAQDPLGEARKLIPVVVEPGCPRPGLLAGVIGPDLSGLDEAGATQRLLQAALEAVNGRSKPTTKPPFPMLIP